MTKLVSLPRVTEAFRLVGVINKDTGEYHFYLTNIPVERLVAEDIAMMYRARWTIELLFKELKSGYALNQISSANPEVITIETNYKKLAKGPLTYTPLIIHSYGLRFAEVFL